ncbi:hypothetical protein BDZ94DRAFT_1273610, partial [Collybia nuda]
MGSSGTRYEVVSRYIIFGSPSSFAQMHTSCIPRGCTLHLLNNKFYIVGPASMSLCIITMYLVMEHAISPNRNTLKRGL